MFISGLVCINFINNRYQVKFDCGKSCNTKIKYVKKGSKVKIPNNPKMENKVFIEWQLNGKKYNFNNKINKNITLKAKWLPEIYVNVIFDMNNGTDNNEFKILAGNNIKDYIKIPTKKGYKFLGWYLDDIKYDTTKIVTSNITLKAKWEPIENNEFKIGDEVLITGKYATSAYSNYANNFVAIGWVRKIVAIYENANYKYALGDYSGITGYFNSNSFRIVN